MADDYFPAPSAGLSNWCLLAWTTRGFFAPTPYRLEIIMAIQAECPACKKRFQGPDKYAGLKKSCPGCGGDILFPAEEDWQGDFESLAPEPERPPSAAAVPFSESPRGLYLAGRGNKVPLTRINVPFEDVFWLVLKFHFATLLIGLVLFLLIKLLSKMGF